MISVAKQLDRETTPYGINLTIQATDSPDVGQAKTSTMELHIDVTDYNDNSPVFNLPIPNRQVSEQDAAGTVIEQVQATDADIGVNAEITYSIMAGNSLGFFEIDPTTGEVKVNKSLDLEGETHAQSLSYILTMEARDQGTPSKATTTSLVIQVRSVNEFTPEFEKTSAYIIVAHNTSQSSTVYKANATDQDFGTDGDLEYTITAGNSDGYFAINQDNGNVYVAKELDYTAVPNGINLTIQVTDLADVGARKTNTMQLNIEVRNGLNTAPVFSQSLPDTVVPESVAVDTVIVKVNATDANPGVNGVFTLSIISGNPLGFFKIDANTGEIKVSQSLDLETKTHSPGARYTLTIEARDEGSPPLAASKTLNIQVTGVNEFTPTVQGGMSVMSGDSTLKSVVGRVVATDQDYGDDGKLTFTAISGNGEQYFSVNESSGTIYLEKTLDYKTTKEYILVIKVEDNAQVGQRRSVNATFDIEVAFVPTNTSDPETKTELEITFTDVDYDTVVLGNEFYFIAQLNATLTAENPGVIFIHFQLRKGSVIATFDMITLKSTKADVLNRITNDPITINFNGQTLKSNTIKVENQTFTVSSPEKEDGDSAMLSVIIGTVVGSVFLVGVVVAVLFACYSKSTYRKKSQKPDSNRGCLPEHDPAPAYRNAHDKGGPSTYPHLQAHNPRVNSLAGVVKHKGIQSMESHHDLLRDPLSSQPHSAFRSVSPTRSKPLSNIGSSYSQPGHSVIPRAKYMGKSKSTTSLSDHGFTGLSTPRQNSNSESPNLVDGSSSKVNPLFDASLCTATSIGSASECGDAAYRKLYVNIVNPESGYLFNRLGDVTANMKGTLRELRTAVDSQFGNLAELKNRQYTFVDRDFNVIAPDRETQTQVRSVYGANVKIKVVVSN